MGDPLKISINANDLASQCKEFAEEVKQEIIEEVDKLAALTHAHILDQAEKRLKGKSFQKKFMESVKFDSVTVGLNIISISDEGLFVEEGIMSGAKMAGEDGKWLLKNSKTNAKGESYNIVPFEWSKPRGEVSTKNKKMVDELKTILADQKVGFRKIETNSKGSPRVGLLHDFNFGGNKPGRGNTPIFDRVRIYQTKVQDEISGKESVRRDIFTFRTVKKSSSKWVHPGMKKYQFLEEAEKWFMQKWEDEILPKIFAKWKE